VSLLTTIAAAAAPSLGEKVFFVCALAFFGIVGLALLCVAMRDIARLLGVRGRLVRLPGTVLTVQKETKLRVNSTDNRPHRSNYVEYFFPVISFVRPDGQRVEFRSEWGQSRRISYRYQGSKVAFTPKWHDGQAVEVFFDPQGEMKPCLASAWSLWFQPLGFLAAGLVTLGLITTLAILKVPTVFG
jgi:hypothetical protein